MTIEVPADALPSRKLRLTILYVLATAAVLCLLIKYLGMSPASFVIDFRFIADLAHQMLPPNIALFWTKWSIFASLVDTLSMAFLGTILGGALALLLAFFAATNTRPIRWCVYWSEPCWWRIVQ